MMGRLCEVSLLCRLRKLTISSSFLSSRNAGTVIRTSSAMAYNGSIYGFEQSKYSDIQTDKRFLEQSLLNGCRTIVARKVPDYMMIYELLSDMHAAEEINLDNIFIAHRVMDHTNEEFNLEETKIQLKSIHNTLLGKKISNMIISMHQLECINQLNELEDFTDSIGIEITTQNILQNNAEKLNNIIQSIDCDYIYLATNPLTAKYILPLIETIQKSAKQYVASDIYRIDPIKPSLFIPSSEISSHHLSIKEAAERMQQVLNACIKLEKTYMSKFQLSTIPASDVCIGHSLVGHIISVDNKEAVSPEQFQYIRRTMIDDKLEAGLGELAKSSRGARDWVTLYTPLARALLQAYSILLQTQRDDMFSAACNLSMSSSRARNVAEHYANLTRNMGPSCVLASSTQVDAELWTTDAYDMSFVVQELERIRMLAVMM